MLLLAAKEVFLQGFPLLGDLRGRGIRWNGLIGVHRWVVRQSLHLGSVLHAEFEFPAQLSEVIGRRLQTRGRSLHRGSLVVDWSEQGLGHCPVLWHGLLGLVLLGIHRILVNPRRHRLVQLAASELVVTICQVLRSLVLLVDVGVVQVG